MYSPEEQEAISALASFSETPGAASPVPPPPPEIPEQPVNTMTPKEHDGALLADIGCMLHPSNADKIDPHHVGMHVDAKAALAESREWDDRMRANHLQQQRERLNEAARRRYQKKRKERQDQEPHDTTAAR